MSTLTTWLLKVRRSTGVPAVCGVSFSPGVRLHAHQVQVASALSPARWIPGGKDLDVQPVKSLF